MLIQSAEESFRRGVNALGNGAHLEALAMFEAAIELERRLGAGGIQARYLSAYGLCLARHARRAREGVYFCREAVQKEPYNPDLHANLGWACLAAGRRREAHEALERGRRLQPEHEDILRAMAEMGRRRPPVLPFLARSHPLNVLLGKLFRSGAASASAAGDRGPAVRQAG